MASNPYVNKVVYGNQTLIDISDSTVSPETLLYGVKAYAASGEPIVGTMKLSNLGQGYGVCSTAADTAQKEVTISDFVLTEGGIVAIKFVNDVGDDALLKIGNSAAKSIYFWDGPIYHGVINSGDTATMMYDGTYFRVLSNDHWGTYFGINPNAGFGIRFLDDWKGE